MAAQGSLEVPGATKEVLPTRGNGEEGLMAADPLTRSLPGCLLWARASRWELQDTGYPIPHKVLKRQGLPSSQCKTIVESLQATT